MDPLNCSESQKLMSSLLVLKNGIDGSYSLFQNRNLDLNLHKHQECDRTNSSKLIRDLLQKSYLVVTNENICTVPNRSQCMLKAKLKDRQIYGQVVRAGDIIRFGMLPVLIREVKVKSQE